MSAVKLGVLTLHRCINYGSYWQARCLVEGLQARGYDAVLLDHESRRVNRAEWRCALQPVLPTAVPRADRALYRAKTRRFFRAFAALPLSPRFPLEHPEAMEAYDTVVVGSDEVWNLVHPWYGRCPLFYGDGIRAQRLVSYAASFGNYQASWGLEPAWADRLRRFAVLSVRDENAQTLISQALGIVPDLVLDPCLQFALEPEARDLEALQEPYLAVYGHNFSATFIQAVRRYAGDRGLPLLSLGYRNDWADSQWITADPHDFVHGIARAEALATNFFHGCVLALRYAKPFVCEASPYRSTKLCGLLTLVGGEHHLMRDDTPAALYRARLSEPVHQGMAQSLARLRHTSEAYLDRALGVRQLQCA